METPQPITLDVAEGPVGVIAVIAYLGDCGRREGTKSLVSKNNIHASHWDTTENAATH